MLERPFAGRSKNVRLTLRCRNQGASGSRTSRLRSRACSQPDKAGEVMRLGSLDEYNASADGLRQSRIRLVARLTEAE
jgi:hypothetical protein